MRRRDKGLAAGALAAGLASLLFFALSAPFAIAFGVWALVRLHVRRQLGSDTWMALVGVVAGVVALTLWVPVFARAHDKAMDELCRCNLEQLGLSMRMYAADHDNRLPLRGNWCDATMPYNKNREVYRCPSAPKLECGYAYNQWLSGLPTADVWDPGSTVMLFDAKTTWSGSGGPFVLDFRHEYQATFAVVDGSVHRLCYDGLARWRPDNGPDFKR